jgi:nucleotide-binding universal stress UspA family protein
LLVPEAQPGPFRTVVAGVDFSDTSREAVTQAMRVARAEDGAVHFVHVFTSPWRRVRRGRALPEVTPEARKEYRAALYQRLRQFVVGADGVRATITLVDADDTGAGLAEYARKAQAGLVVVGRRGESNLNYLLLGSTVERLLPEISCSVLVV